MANPWIDISYPIENGMPQWPGDEIVRMTKLCEVGPESIVQITKLDWLSHMATHLDAPAHFIEHGESIDSLSLDRCSGTAEVVWVDGDAVEACHVPIDCADLCVLFKTRNGDLWASNDFRQDYVYVSSDASHLLVQKGAKLVGVDYMSVDQWGSDDYPSHYALLSSNVLILEGLDLRNVEPGRYEFVAFPLKISSCDGSPVRAALRAL